MNITALHLKTLFLDYSKVHYTLLNSSTETQNTKIKLRVIQLISDKVNRIEYMKIVSQGKVVSQRIRLIAVLSAK